MWPAPCSWRTRMWRIVESISGSYAGRMAPPGSPNMTSTPSISRLLMRAWAPVSFIGAPQVGPRRRHASGHEKPPAERGAEAHGRGERRALGNYEGVGGVRHGTAILAWPRGT